MYVFGNYIDGLVGWLYSGFTSLQRYFSHIATWKQEITNLWKSKWRGRESNPGPLAPQAKSLTTRSPLLLHWRDNAVYKKVVWRFKKIKNKNLSQTRQLSQNWIHQWCVAVCIIRRYYCVNRDVIGENTFYPVLRLWWNIVSRILNRDFY